MTEPTNPLFEDEKDFLERKKLEYERALRGDVAEIKENTVQAGKVALVGAGIAGGIWLLTKVFGGRKAKPKRKKHKHKKHHTHFEDYAGFDGFDENDQELSELADDFQAPDYAYEPDQSATTEDGFYSEGTIGTDDVDDNGFGDYPDFPKHSFPHHGPDVYHTDEDHGDDDEPEAPAHSYASTSSYQARPYDDSRRLPHSDSFAEPEQEETSEPAPATPKRSVLVPVMVSFAKSETGRVVLAQAAALALALATKALQEIMPKDKAEAGKNADLAASSATVGIPPATWPATSAASDASAAAHHDDDLTSHKPLA